MTVKTTDAKKLSFSINHFENVKKNKTSFNGVAQNALKNQVTLNGKKVKASLWSKFKNKCRKLFSCGGESVKSKSANTQKAFSKISLAHSQKVSSVNTIEMLNYGNFVKTTIEKALCANDQKLVLDQKSYWKQRFVDYVPRNLKKLNLALETLREYQPKAPEADALKAKGSPYMHNNISNRIGFKNFPDFNISIEHSDLICSKAEVIVNAANQELWGGGGIDGAIHEAGGAAYEREHWNLRKHYDSAFTRGFAAMIPQVKFPLSTKDVIVVCGPSSFKTAPTTAISTNGELYSCYRNSLELAHKHGKASIAFPAISTGIFNYPLIDAAAVSLKAIEDFMIANPESQLKNIAIHSWHPNVSRRENEGNWKFYQQVVQSFPNSMQCG